VEVGGDPDGNGNGEYFDAGPGHAIVLVLVAIHISSMRFLRFARRLFSYFFF